MVWINNYDSQGNIIKPGDVCARCTRNGSTNYCVFLGSAWGGSNSNGDYGRFISDTGKCSIKFSNIIFVLDPLGERIPTEGYKELVRTFYEQNK